MNMLCIYVHVHAYYVASVLFDSLRLKGLYVDLQFLCPGDLTGNNTGMGCHALPQESSQPRD